MRHSFTFGCRLVCHISNTYRNAFIVVWPMFGTISNHMNFASVFLYLFEILGNPCILCAICVYPFLGALRHAMLAYRNYGV